MRFNNKVNTKDLFSLKDKLAIVIGGMGKIGTPICEALLESEATLIICSSNKKNLNLAYKKFRNFNKKIHTFKMDQSQPLQINSFIKKIKKEFKIPDVLFNSAVNRPMKKYIKDTYKNFDKSMEINARGLFLLNRGFGDLMKLQKSGSIINISSIYGVVAPDPNIYTNSKINTEPDYPFIKGGTIAMTKYFASYYAKYNIRYNVLVPGGLFNDQDKSFVSNYCKKVPLSRMAYPNDIKGPAIFLASDASSYITGSSVFVDGGYTIL